MALPILSGTARLTADPELRFGPSGTAVAKLNLAFNSRRKNQQTGEWEDGDVLFVGGTLFADQAEAAAEHLLRGAEVAVSGRLKTRQWETKEGEKRSTVELLIDSIGPTVRGLSKKSDRAKPTTAKPGEDPWATPATGGGFGDEPPF